MHLVRRSAIEHVTFDIEGEGRIISDDRIYNIMGVQMDENLLAPGIYIKNGKKFVKK